ncbi:hypothetical protein WICMUC_002167 [Wickerhamomyces mucosus]|uniref:BZIP domain-containing protein n=1 Tax=Wickerhamomyces mucosus TaxID=1378264 RepID=A0A9P8TEZ7_9ASCO|nr:hypothetical protein WICMUC_002167 [Wickerhamomyces mucosus]
MSRTNNNINNNSLGFLNQLNMDINVADYHNNANNNNNNSPNDVSLEQFMDSSFFDLDNFYSEQQPNGSQITNEKFNLHQQFQVQMNKQEQLIGSQIHDDYLKEFIKKEESEGEAFQILHTNDSPTSIVPITVVNDLPKKIQLTSSTVISTPKILPESEADKKQRNTAASARFRIKKKLREQEMERSLKNLTEKVQFYNQKIQQLEFENKCLKSLIIEKNEQKSDDLLKSIKEKSVTNIDEFIMF